MRFIFVLLYLAGSFAAFTQNRISHAHTTANSYVRNTHHLNVTRNSFLPDNHSIKTNNFFLFSSEIDLGFSCFDLQTNHATQNRIFLYPDGTIGAVWIHGNSYVSYIDRGTGYNYYNGLHWLDPPAGRIENVRTGWPSYNPWESAGEIITTHTGTANGVCIARRTIRNFGLWEFLYKPGPLGWETLLWPRSVTSGPNHEFLHLIALTPPVRNGGVPYYGQDGSLLYSRSIDGGNSWQINNFQLPETDTNYYYCLNPDCYSFAFPKADKLAFIYGDPWSDLFLMKSGDNGDTWTKTLIFKHPYPRFKEETTLVTDTPWVTDGAANVVLDNSGKAHVFFGCIQVLNDILHNGETTLFPFSDGLGYWNEDMPVIPSMCPDSLELHNQLVGYMQDVNGNDTIGEFVDIAPFNLSVTSMPNATIDDNGDIFLFFTSIMEHFDNGVQNYRHLFGRAFTNGYWHDFVDLTKDPSYIFADCVFPTVAPLSDDYCYLMFQKDEEPGLFFYPNGIPVDNHHIFMKVSKSELITGIPPDLAGSVSPARCFPNPTLAVANLEFQNNMPGMVYAEVHNAVGEVILRTPSTWKSADKHIVSIDVSSVAPGLYFFTVFMPNNRLSGKFLIGHHSN